MIEKRKNHHRGVADDDSVTAFAAQIARCVVADAYQLNLPWVETILVKVRTGFIDLFPMGRDCKGICVSFGDTSLSVSRNGHFLRFIAYADLSNYSNTTGMMLVDMIDKEIANL